MKNCPKCNSELDDNFDLCWKCNYSFLDNKIVEIQDKEIIGLDLNCLRCKSNLVFSGNYNFHEGAKIQLLSGLFQNRKSFDIYLCTKCGKVEFFTPQSKL